MTVQGVPGIEEHWAKIRQDTDPENWLDACLADNPHFVEQRPLELLPRAIENRELGLRLNRMIWAVIRPSYRDWSFLTSDNPLIISENLTKPEAHVSIALSADALFLAVADKATLNAVLQMGDRGIFEAHNQIVVDRASRFVGAADRTQDRFIRNNYGRKPGLFIRRVFEELLQEAA